MSPKTPRDPIDSFIRQVQATRKYRHICQDTIRDVIQNALPKYKNTHDAFKAARTKLHRIQAAYLGKQVIAQHLDAARLAHQTGDIEQLKTIARRLMQDHASTAERMPYLDTFYRDLFAVTGTPRTVLDLACGVHPLSIPWMDLPQDAVYHAYEITADLVQCLNGFLAAIGRPALVKLQDVIANPPQEPGDLAFLMKMVPCLERRQKGIAVKLIERLRVPRVVVSFPVQSLSGRSKNMPQFYTKTFTQMVDGHGWRLTKLPIRGELVFVLDKRNPT